MEHITNFKIPVIIAGCGRSGTTFLRFVLTANEDIFIPNESGFIIDYLKYGDLVPRHIVKKLLFREPLLKLWYNEERFFLKNTGETIRRIHEIEASKLGCHIWGQKTPKFVRYIDLLNIHLGPVKWVLIYRDPRAVISSMLRSERHTYSLGKAVKRWIKDNTIIIDLMNKYDKANIIFVKYENLINNFDDESKRIFDFLGSKSVSIHDLEKKGKPGSYLDGSKMKNITVDKTFVPNNASLSKWKRSLTDKQVKYIERKCKAAMEYLGYLPYYSLEKRPSFLTVLNSMFSNLLIIRIVSVFIKRWPLLLIYTGYRKLILFYYFYVKKSG